MAALVHDRRCEQSSSTKRMCSGVLRNEGASRKWRIIVSAESWTLSEPAMSPESLIQIASELSPPSVPKFFIEPCALRKAWHSGPPREPVLVRAVARPHRWSVNQLQLLFRSRGWSPRPALRLKSFPLAGGRNSAAKDCESPVRSCW